MNLDDFYNSSIPCSRECFLSFSLCFIYLSTVFLATIIVLKGTVTTTNAAVLMTPSYIRVLADTTSYPTTFIPYLDKNCSRCYQMRHFGLSTNEGTPQRDLSRARQWGVCAMNEFHQFLGLKCMCWPLVRNQFLHLEILFFRIQDL